MRTLHSYWEELKSCMKKYDDCVYATIDVKAKDDGSKGFVGFVCLGQYPNWHQTGIHDCKSPEELIRKAEGWAKIVTTKLKTESKDIAL